MKEHNGHRVCAHVFVKLQYKDKHKQHHQHHQIVQIAVLLPWNYKADMQKQIDMKQDYMRVDKMHTR